MMQSVQVVQQLGLQLMQQPLGKCIHKKPLSYRLHNAMTVLFACSHPTQARATAATSARVRTRLFARFTAARTYLNEVNTASAFLSPATSAYPKTCAHALLCGTVPGGL